MGWDDGSEKYGRSSDLFRSFSQFVVTMTTNPAIVILWAIDLSLILFNCLHQRSCVRRVPI
jgi:hypothetical protein